MTHPRGSAAAAAMDAREPLDDSASWTQGEEDGFVADAGSVSATRRTTRIHSSLVSLLPASSETSRPSYLISNPREVS